MSTISSVIWKNRQLAGIDPWVFRTEIRRYISVLLRGVLRRICSYHLWPLCLLQTFSVLNPLLFLTWIFTKLASYLRVAVGWLPLYRISCRIEVKVLSSPFFCYFCGLTPIKSEIEFFFFFFTSTALIWSLSLVNVMRRLDAKRR